jgi:hypothetical protein
MYNENDQVMIRRTPTQVGKLKLVSSPTKLVGRIGRIVNGDDEYRSAGVLVVEFPQKDITCDLNGTRVTDRYWLFGFDDVQPVYTT